MEKSKINPEDFRRLEYEFNETKDVLPQEVKDITELVFDLLRTPALKILPMYNELVPVISELLYKQYPSLSVLSNSWAVCWINDICEDVAMLVPTQLASLFHDSETGNNRADMYDNLESMIETFATPSAPYHRELPDLEGTPGWEEMKPEFLVEIEEEYQEEIVLCAERNRMKTEFIESIQPFIFKYFQSEMEALNADLWTHYGIEIGFIYSEYQNACFGLIHIVEDNDIPPENPGLHLFAYQSERHKRISERYKNQQKLS